MFTLLLFALGCPTPDDSAALTADQCTATYGDKCGCEAQCLSPAEMDALDEVERCDLDCDPTGAGITWSCAVVAGACAIEE